MSNKNVNQSENPKAIRLWQPIEFSENWQNADTSILDGISASWFARRVKLVENSTEFATFLERQKREHAIETGIIERLYDMSKGLTETFIKSGFHSALVSHGDSDIETASLMNHLNDHLDAVNFVFDTVKNERPFSVSFIKQLHQLVTRNQNFAEGRDQFGHKLKIELLKGTFKIRENNPTRTDGTAILYCPPEHVAAEMDNLMAIFDAETAKNTHPLILAAWMHHAFSIIHPFQDGNGRVARLITSLILIKNGFFPFTVPREEAKARYIFALEKADENQPRLFVNYIGENQKRSIEKALNIQEVSADSLVLVQEKLLKKLKNSKITNLKEVFNSNKAVYLAIFEVCETFIDETELQLSKKFGVEMKVDSIKSAFDDGRKVKESGSQLNDFFTGRTFEISRLNNYEFKPNLPKSWILLSFIFDKEIRYNLVFTIHHFGYDAATIAIGVFLEKSSYNSDWDVEQSWLMPLPPFIFSILSPIENQKKNIRSFMEDGLTWALAQIASEI
jgi:prophage maintenance system killer protein